MCACSQHLHYYGPFVSGCVCVCTLVWEELCRSRGLDNWLVLECQMDEEGIMVDSSCCHGVEVGMWRPPVKGGATELFVNGPLAFLERLPSRSLQLRPTGRFCGEGMGTQEPGSKRVTFLHLRLAASTLPLFLFLDPPLLYSPLAPSLPVCPPPWFGLLCPMSYFSVHLFYFKAYSSLS